MRVAILLLLLKDLWTGDLPIGGESSIGRGRLQGKSAEICHGEDKWRIEEIYKQEIDKIEITGNAQQLEGFVEKFVKVCNDKVQGANK